MFPITDENDKAAVVELLATRLHHNFGRILDSEIRVMGLDPSVCIPADFVFAYKLTDSAGEAVIKATG